MQQGSLSRRTMPFYGVASALAVLFASTAAIAQEPPPVYKRWYVDGTAPAGGNGAQWPTAFRDLQEALEASGSDQAPVGERNEIWVAAGTGAGYAPTSQEGGLMTEVREPTFDMQTRLAIFGGFEGYGNDSGAQEDELSQRDPITNVTILTGHLAQPTNCPDHRCFISPGYCDCMECEDRICDNLPYCCESPGPGWDQGCAGVAHELCSYYYNSYHVVTYDAGPDILQTAQLDGFRIIGGRAEGNDGFYDTSELETFAGGALIRGPVNTQPQDVARPVIARCTLAGNDGNQGGGVHIRGHADPSFLACSFIGNTAGEGAGIHVEPANPPEDYDVPEATLVNCLLADNTATEHGGGIASGGPALSVINCTLAINDAGSGGGGVWIELDSQVTIRNSILWDNTPQQILQTLGAAHVYYSDVDGGWAGSGANNKDEDPMFVHPVFDPVADFRLQLGSPVADAGDPDESEIPLDNFDLDHDTVYMEATPDLAMRARVIDGPDADVVVAVDMGAYEQTCPWDCDGSGDGDVNVADLLQLLGEYDINAPNDCAGGANQCDFDDDGCVGVIDLLMLLSHYVGTPDGIGCPGDESSAQQGLQQVIENESLELSESWSEILNQAAESEAEEK